MSRLSHSEALKLKIGLAEPRLNLAARRLWAHPRLPELFPDYLLRLYASVRAAVPLMRQARTRARGLASSCKVAAALVPYLEEHIEEELHHDEWLLSDIEALGLSREDVARRPPDPTVATLIGTLYYWVLHAHPVAVMAYLAVVEGNPMTPAELDQLAARGIPPAALRTLYEHARLDVGHGEEVFRTIDELPLKAEHTEVLGLASVVVIEQLSEVIENLLAEEAGAHAGTRRLAGAPAR